jgi:hypothetical protein
MSAIPAYLRELEKHNKDLIDVDVSSMLYELLGTEPQACIDNTLNVLDIFPGMVFVYGFIVSTDTAQGTQVTEHCWNEFTEETGKVLIADPTLIIEVIMHRATHHKNYSISRFHYNTYFPVCRYTKADIDNLPSGYTSHIFSKNKNVKQVLEEAKMFAQQEAGVFDFTHGKFRVRRFGKGVK